jgi:ribosomal-protein-alanine N-acetyltransferase
MKGIHLETERLLLRPFRLGDEAEVLAFSSNPIINKYTGDPIITTMEGITKLIKEVWLYDYKKYGYGRFAVVHKKDTKIIGFCGVKFLTEANETDLGFRFLPEYWGQGIATESSEAILEYAFNTLQLSTIVATADPENKGSTNVLEKLKFQYEKTEPYPNEMDPLLWYRLTKKNYEGQ